MKAIREELAKGPGDRVAVTMERDSAERTVTSAKKPETRTRGIEKIVESLTGVV
ncbi:hypothetical protein ACFV4K_17565 [Nocardia sp. NPDC059764]|uniref:hypothetical protein n=1 Tax=Nocardia sp. NPDC059764 TaxID=3346939 RepID=UPI003669A648